MKGATGGVADDEQLYRRVRQSIGAQVCYQIEAGELRFLHAAFNDPARCPSVDRARLAGQEPHSARMSVADGVVTLKAEAIRRRIGPIPKFNDKGKRLKESYGVDVISDPRYGNCSHALVVITPPNGSGGAFMKLKEGLARLATEAGWTIAPQSALPNQIRLQALRVTVRCLIQRFKGNL